MKQELCYIPLDVLMGKRMQSCPFVNGAELGCEFETDNGTCDKSDNDNCPNVLYMVL